MGRPAQYVDKVGTTRAFRVRCTEHRGPARNHWDTVVAKEVRESFWIEKYVREPVKNVLADFFR